MTSISLGAPAPAVFDFQSHQVRIVTKNGEPWFVASDVCNALGYSNTSKAVGDHLDADERASEMVPTPNAPLGVPTNIISESGLYALVLRSRKPEARKFAKWVTSEVLPAIRKTGQYSAAAGDMISKAHALRCFAMTSALTGPAHTAVMNQLLDHNEHDVQYGRFLVTFCGETPFVKAVPNDAAVMTQAQFLRALTEGNAVPVSTQDLAQFIEAATKKLAQRCAFYEGKAGRRAA
ncbi:MAG: Bro-N domain-containing protein [Thiomonas sp.]